MYNFFYKPSIKEISKRRNILSLSLFITIVICSIIFAAFTTCPHYTTKYKGILCDAKIYPPRTEIPTYYPDSQFRTMDKPVELSGIEKLTFMRSEPTFITVLLVDNIQVSADFACILYDDTGIAYSQGTFAIYSDLESNTQAQILNKIVSPDLLSNCTYTTLSWDSTTNSSTIQFTGDCQTQYVAITYKTITDYMDQLCWSHLDIRNTYLCNECSKTAYISLKTAYTFIGLVCAIGGGSYRLLNLFSGYSVIKDDGIEQTPNTFEK